MNCTRRLKTTMCIAATMTMLLTVDFNIADAVTLSTEKGIAGISLSLDKYYSADVSHAIKLPAGTQAANVLAAADAAKEDLINVSDTGAASQADTGAAAESKVNAQAVEDAHTNSANALKKAADTKSVKKTNTAAKKKAQVKKVSKYENMGISVAPSYVNIRKSPNTDSKVLGKLYKGCAATITQKKGDWVKIKSGNVHGYIKAEYLAIGFDAEELEDKYGTKLATVNTTTLKVRETPSLKATCLTMIPKGETYEVMSINPNWVRISIDADEEDQIKGYVSRDYMDITVEFDKAISIEEEKAELEREEAARKAEQEQLAKLALQQQQQITNSQSSSKGSSNSSSSSSSSSKGNSSSSNKSSSNKSSSSSSGSKKKTIIADAPSGSGSGSQIANYALKFVGNPYVYGGTSLTGGTDCSGFTQAVYRSFGKSIPRDSRSQAAGAGKEVSLGSLQAGDLVFYTGGSGRVNHVALYIGGGKVVHASNPRSGIKVSAVNYRTPYKARRVVN